MIFSANNYKEALRLFYDTTDLKIESIERREFMFGHKVRHFSFKSIKDLREYVTTNTPTSITHSLARYHDPSRRRNKALEAKEKDKSGSSFLPWTMADKGYAGIDIGFDIDYDHLPGITSYRQGLEQAKDNALRLLDFLTNDLNMPIEAISFRFSGNRGYHMVVTEESLLKLGKEERTGIENYVRGHDMHLSGFIHTSTDKGAWSNKGGHFEYSLYTPPTPGWGGRFTKTFIEMVDEYRSLPDDESRLALLNKWTPIKQEIKESIFNRPSFMTKKGEPTKKKMNKPTYMSIHDFLMNDYALNGLSRDWRLSHWAKVSSMKPTAVKRLIEMVIQQTQLRRGVEADAITKDLHRQLRTPGSLHTTSGMPCIEITYEMLQDLDLMFDHIRETMGKDAVEVEVTNEVYVHALDRTVYPGTYKVPRYEAYSIICADKIANDDK
jgi:DNA primase small subunit